MPQLELDADRVDLAEEQVQKNCHRALEERGFQLGCFRAGVQSEREVPLAGAEEKRWAWFGVKAFLVSLR